MAARALWRRGRASLAGGVRTARRRWVTAARAAKRSSPWRCRRLHPRPSQLPDPSNPAAPCSSQFRRSTPPSPTVASTTAAAAAGFLHWQAGSSTVVSSAVHTVLTLPALAAAAPSWNGAVLPTRCSIKCQALVSLLGVVELSA